MKLAKSFELGQRRDVVWNAMGDLRLVAECLPGAAILDQLDEDRYRGRFAVKIGPLAASFDGEVRIERDKASWTALVTGKGADARSSSRAFGSMSYRLLGGEAGSTRVEVTSEIDLAGPLAQFGKAAVMQEIASRITDAFVRNFERRLSACGEDRGAGAPEGMAAGDTRRSQPLDAGSLAWAIVRDRIMAFLRRLLGRQLH